MKYFKASIWTIIALLVAISFNCSGDDNSGGDAQSNITVTGSFLNFGEINVLSSSESQTISVKGQSLTAALNVVASENFELSLDDISFSNSIAISKSSANAEAVTVYVRFSPQESAVGVIQGSLTFQSSGATSKTLSVAGVGVSITPAITVNRMNLDFGEVQVNQSSDTQQLMISGDNLENETTVNTSSDFEVSLDGVLFSDSVQIDLASINENTTIYVRFAPSLVGETNGNLTIQNILTENVEVTLSGTGLPIAHNYVTFNQQPLGFGGGFNQSASQVFNLHSDLSNVAQIKMYLQIDCPTTGCDDWDRFANVKVKDPETGNWFEIGRYITPYWVGTQQLERGLEFDVTDFRSLLSGSVELRIYIENWTQKADLITLEFDYLEGTPDYPYYAVSEVLGFHANSISGVPYGVTHGLDLDKSINIPGNTESTHLRTVISGWGHATPADSDGRTCAEWCYRTHGIKINGTNMFSHNLGPIGCASNPISNQNPGNWQPDRAGWCPGMVVPVRVDNLVSSMAGSTFTFEYDFEDWSNNSGNGDAYYATSTYVVVKSNTPLAAPTVTD